jgi:integrase/recombinase XerD
MTKIDPKNEPEKLIEDTSIPYRNEQAKRRFFEHLSGGEGFAGDSVSTFAEAVGQWQQFSKNDDFVIFDKSKAMEFVAWQKTRPTKAKGGTLALQTQYNYLRRIKRFFMWLAEQKEYKKIRKTDVDFLRLPKKEVRIATSGTTRPMPSFEEVKRIIMSIHPKNEIDERDRAILSLALITGMRISAIATLKIKNFNRTEKLFDQNPGDGVLTKNSKKILTTFFPIGWSGPEQFFLEWYDLLIKKGVKPDSPIFPSTLKGFSAKNDYSKTLVSDESWASSSGARKIFEKRCKAAGVQYFNPHSFRHLIVNYMSKARLTEEEKKAISMNLGHENVGTTFGSYGYGNMTPIDAVKIVQKLKVAEPDGQTDVLTPDERAILEKLIKRSL